MTTRNENPSGAAGALNHCCGGGCNESKPTTIPPQNQRLHPMARHALQNLQFALLETTERDHVQESGLRACDYLLRNF